MRVDAIRSDKDNPADGAITFLASNPDDLVMIFLMIFLRFGHAFLGLSGKFKKQRSYEHNSLFDAVMLSIENLNEYHKKLYKQLAVFLDDVGIPPKVR